MEITGRIIAVLPPQSGVSQRTGQPWVSQNFVIQTDERFPQKLVFKIFGEDKLRQFAIQMGETLTVQFSVDAHESNGRWFGENSAYNVFRAGQQMQQPMQQMPAQNPFPPQGQQQVQQPQMQQAPAQNPFPQQPMQQQVQQPAPGAAPFPPQMQGQQPIQGTQQMPQQQTAPQGQSQQLPF